jgi:hypothetical protein
MHVGLERVHLKVGNADVPLRSTQLSICRGNFLAKALR